MAETKTGINKKQQKSGAKMNGLKSVLIMEDKVQMTSFGKGSKAILEKEVVDGALKDINTEDPIFSAGDRPSQYEIKRVGVNVGKAGYIDKNVRVRNDLINAKGELEKRFFGCEKGDNVHIQVIHNILDIEKILAGHIDNIVYPIANVLGGEDKTVDLIGDLGGKTYGKFQGHKDYGYFMQLYGNEKLRFFGGAFFDTGVDIKAPKTIKVGKEKKETAVLRPVEDVYYMLSLLGSIRQFTKHGGKTPKEDTWLYILDNNLKTEEKDILNRLYAESINAINKDFIHTNDKNLTILFGLFHADNLEKKQAILERFYRFVICKDARNMGFCVKTLREAMIDKYMPELRDKSCNSFRSKLYRLFDFTILSHYLSEDGAKDAEDFVNKLRSCMDEEQKEACYKEQADKKWPVLKLLFSNIRESLGDGSKVQSIVPNKEELGKLTLDGIRISPKDTSYYSKVMYLMTLFLDGKEINDLLTGMINKLDNIQSFNDFMKENGTEMFADIKGKYNYSFFRNAGKVADELRVVKSIARMQKPLPSAKEFMYKEAMSLFGYEDLDVKIFTGEKAVRNFVANSVMESSRFQYIIRYVDMKCAGKLAKCRPVVEFVLNKVPETQIDRYWQSCAMDESVRGLRERVSGLADLICNFDRDIFTKQRLEAKEKKQAATAIIGLYLSVVYQIVKGLVFVNSKYTMAFHALERDTELLGGKSIFSGNFAEVCKYEELFYLTNRYIGQQTAYLEKRIAMNKRANKHGLKCIVASKDSVGNERAHYWACRSYRNAVAHLDAVTHADKYIGLLSDDYKMTSYFALYHFIMQEYLMHDPFFANEADGAKIGEWAKAVDKYKGFNKDWLWALNSPFAYNPPRYKTLSIENIFYKDEKAVVKE